MDKIIAKLLELLEAEFGTDFKAYYWDSPETQVVNRTLLPAIFVHPNSSNISNRGTVKDNNEFTVTISAVLDMKTYLNNQEEDGINSMENQLVKWAQETDSENEIIDKTIIGVLRKYIELEDIVLYNNNILINYDTQVIDTKDSLLKKVDIEVTFHRQGVRNT